MYTSALMALGNSNSNSVRKGFAPVDVRNSNETTSNSSSSSSSSSSFVVAVSNNSLTLQRTIADNLRQQENAYNVSTSQRTITDNVRQQDNVYNVSSVAEHDSTLNTSLISDEDVNELYDQADIIKATLEGEVTIPFEDKIKLINYCKAMLKCSLLEQEMISEVVDITFITRVFK